MLAALAPLTASPLFWCLVVGLVAAVALDVAAQRLSRRRAGIAAAMLRHPAGSARVPSQRRSR